MTNRVAVVSAFLAGAALVAVCVVAYGPANSGPALAEKKAMLRQLATTSMLSGTHTVMGRSDFRSDALFETGLNGGCTSLSTNGVAACVVGSPASEACREVSSGDTYGTFTSPGYPAASGYYTAGRLDGNGHIQPRVFCQIPTMPPMPSGPGYLIDWEGGAWILVRRVKKGTTWHPAKDHCLGSEEYNTDIPSSQRIDSEADVTWSIKWDDLPYDQILFASGDAQHWLITTKEAVGEVGADNQYYSNAQRDIIKSSDSAVPYTARWYNRVGALEDPWISVNDHGGAIAEGKIVYGENSFNWPSHNDLLEDHNGANVFIRRISLHPQ